MYKLLRTILLALLLVILLVLISGYLFLRTSLPLTHGSVSLPGLKDAVEIVRDEDGVPHIFANNDPDAFFALGYLHAQDRMWQLEMNRRIGNGRLSEVLGDAALDLDKLQRTIGYGRIVRQDYEKLDEATKQILQAYAAGINGWIEEGHTLPTEFLILGVNPEPWTVYDSLVWAKMMAWDLGGDYDMELLRLQLLQRFDEERMGQLLPGYPKEGVNIVRSQKSEVRSQQPAVSSQQPTISPGECQLSTFNFQLSTLNSQLSTFNSSSALRLLKLDSSLQVDFGLGGRDLGSNNWVISGRRTASGKPILASDPHLNSSIPSVWYLAEIQGERIHVVGATLPGVPGVIMGHNRRIAWGMTNLNPDVQDLYVERINPANPHQYEVNGEWHEIESYSETIQIQGVDQPLSWAARWTRHGPLISDVTDVPAAMMAGAVALRWTALDGDDTTVASFLALNYAQDWESFGEALRLFVGPAQNFVYADSNGNIGYYGAGRIPIRAKGDGFLPAPGWTDEYAWLGWIPFTELPQSYNPPIGYIASANNRVADAGYPYFLSNDWAEPFRAQRIVDLIEQMSGPAGKIEDGKIEAKITLEDVMRMQGDQTSNQTRQLLPILLQIKASDDRQQEALDLLEQWDGNLSLTSIPATIYEAWVIELNRALIEDDLRGDLYTEMADRSDLTFVANTLRDPAQGAVWCDNLLTVAAESCAEIAHQALNKALDSLETLLGPNMARWQWEKVHLTQYPHQPFSEVPYLRWFYHRTIPNGGNDSTINVATTDASEPYNQYNVPSYRQIIDLADLNNSRFIQTTGQSGNPLSRHYADLIKRHRDVQYLPMLFGREAVDGDVLRLESQ